MEASRYVSAWIRLTGSYRPESNRKGQLLARLPYKLPLIGLLGPGGASAYVE
jgi:hypothetical protein